MQVSQLQYDLKQDRATIVVHDPATGRHVHVNGPLKTGGGLKEKELEDRMKAEAKRILQDAIQAL